MLCFIIITFTCFLQLAKPSNLREDTLLQGHPLAATDRLISPSSLYTLRFFQLDDGSEASTKFYLGISANKYYYYVWLANRDNPIHDDPGVLTIDEYGNLKIVSSTTTMMLYSVEAESNKSVRASLLDTGNFVLHELNLDGSVKRVLWQSFDYPTDTILPGMKLGYDKHSGHKWSLTARRSYKTLWSGSFSLSLDPKINQLITRWRGDIIWASGEWRNGSFSNLISSSLDREKFNFTFFSNESVTYFEYSPVSGYLIMGPLGIINATGVSYSCVGSEIVPGCTMPQPPKCREDGDLYLPSWNSFGAMSRKGYIFDERENMTISDCWMRCLKNCSCEAYTYAFKDATGCEIWSRYTSHFVESNSGVGRPIFFFLSETKASKFIHTAVRSSCLLHFTYIYRINSLLLMQKARRGEYGLLVLRLEFFSSYSHSLHPLSCLGENKNKEVNLHCLEILNHKKVYMRIQKRVYIFEVLIIFFLCMIKYIQLKIVRSEQMYSLTLEKILKFLMHAMKEEKNGMRRGQAVIHINSTL